MGGEPKLNSVRKSPPLKRCVFQKSLYKSSSSSDRSQDGYIQVGWGEALGRAGNQEAVDTNGPAHGPRLPSSRHCAFR